MKKISTIETILTFLTLVFLFSSCFKDEDPEQETRYGQTDAGLYVLCEGTGTDNNASLSYFNFADSNATGDYFQGGLGKNANDMICVGDRLYICVTESACVWVLNLADASPIKRIEIVDENGENRKPRHMVEYKGYVYVSCWDGKVVKISSQSLEICGVCPTNGRYPEGIAVCDNLLYVANSGGLDNNKPIGYDKTVAVIDIDNAFDFVQNIEVKENPQVVKAYRGRVYVLSTGNYSSCPELTVIEGKQIVKKVQKNMVDFDFYGDKIYFFYTEPFVNPAHNRAFNLSCQDIDDLDQEAVVLHKDIISGMMMPYHIDIIDKTMFVCDRKLSTSSGQVFALTLQGEPLYKFNVLLNPGKVVKKKI